MTAPMTARRRGRVVPVGLAVVVFAVLAVRTVTQTPTVGCGVRVVCAAEVVALSRSAAARVRVFGLPRRWRRPRGACPPSGGTELARPATAARVDTGSSVWHRRAGGRAATVLCVLVAVLVTGLGAPAAGQPAPTPTPTPTPTPGAGCGQGVPAGQLVWCFDWVEYTPSPVPQAPSRWLTVCTRAVATDEHVACEAASLTLDSPPPNRSPSVLRDTPTGKDLVDCGLFTQKSTTDPAHALAWKTKYERCVRLNDFYLARLRDPPPSRCGDLDLACQAKEGADRLTQTGVRSGLQGMIDLTVQSVAWLLSQLAVLVFTTTSPDVADETFYSVYNSTAGMLLLLIVLFFIISVIINGLRVNGPGPASSLGGLVRAFLGITFAGGIAWTIVAAWDEATVALIQRNADTPWQPAGWIQGLTSLSGGVGTGMAALAIASVCVIGLILLFIMMLFRGLLATGAALFGAMAMTGQILPETRHWGRRWFWTVNALASSKFFIVALWIYGSRGAYESDIMTSLKALLMIWMMVAAPVVLLRLTTIWDGYLSDVDARGVAAAVVTATGLGSLPGAGGSEGSGGGGAAQAASGLLDTNVADLATVPARGLAGAVGIGDGPGRDIAGAVGAGPDGEPTGDPSTAAQAGSGTDGSSDGGVGQPNAEEAEGIGAGTDSARHDLAQGELTAPGDTTGAQGALPVTPPVPGQDLAATPGAGSGTPSPGPQGTADSPTGSTPAGGSGPGAAGAAGVADVPVVPM